MYARGRKSVYKELNKIGANYDYRKIYEADTVYS